MESLDNDTEHRAQDWMPACDHRGRHTPQLINFCLSSAPSNSIVDYYSRHGRIAYLIVYIGAVGALLNRV